MHLFFSLPSLKYIVGSVLTCVAFGFSPGRIFAVTELKLMLAHVFLNNDVKLENGGPHLANMFIESSVVPDRNGRIMFRKRGVTA